MALQTFSLFSAFRFMSAPAEVQIAGSSIPRGPRADLTLGMGSPRFAGFCKPRQNSDRTTIGACPQKPYFAMTVLRLNVYLPMHRPEFFQHCVPQRSHE